MAKMVFSYRSEDDLIDAEDTKWSRLPVIDAAGKLVGLA
jgi:hypothetical protein